MSAPLTFEGKIFLSSSEAAKSTGYSSDYIGQLCRGGKLVCRRVGKGWFVEEGSLVSYKALDLNHAPSKAVRLNGSSPKAPLPPEHVYPAIDAFAEPGEKAAEAPLLNTATTEPAPEPQTPQPLPAEPMTKVESVSKD